jgi:outer membrane protein
MFRNATQGKVIILCGVFALLLSGAMAYAAEMKIGYVDIQRALNESDAGKKAKVIMESEYGKFQTEIARRRKELQDFQETMQKQGMMLSEQARKEKERDYQNKVKDAKRWTEDRQAELKQKEVELTKAALQGLGAVVKKLGEEEKFTLILEKNELFILYASGAIDLTDRVIELFNATSKK